ncbi:EAL domain-containing protein [Thioclava atlantica]|uniref:EAL domain-containing protein n=1 Tax=Thioclava atlantica TaxID=1317124 RepID=A0A085TZ40_9RHOB|nr:EAL domain-containing protein [Thioclava atlantica]KFE35987.1 EAL domain-containing protein [Thioclava atlantica]
MTNRMATSQNPAPRAPDPLLADALAERERQTVAMVREAVERRDVLLAFQPVIQTQRPERPAFHEGLVRVLDETGKVIPAREFIAAVETTETGRQLDCIALEKGLRALLEHDGLRLSINMSARSIGYPPWTKILTQAFTIDPTIAERLILEITESSAMHMPELVSVFMEDLQAFGVSFALDDFGAGYTSFRYLRDFYFDILKIDGQFIRGIAHDPDNQTLAKALIDIARHFEMLTVAEGIENQEDGDYLAAQGIDCMQGYYFGAPTIHPPWAATAERGRKSA